jgi:hypothetical protein
MRHHDGAMTQDEARAQMGLPPHEPAFIPVGEELLADRSKWRDLDLLVWILAARIWRKVWGRCV